MGFKLLAIAVAVAAGGLGGCATGPRLAVPVSQAGSDRLRLLWVKAYPARDGVEVSGRVRRAPLYVGVIGGHLHVEGRFADGRAPVVADTRWGGLPSRGTSTAAFAAVLRTDRPADIAEIRVEHRLRDDAG